MATTKPLSETLRLFLLVGRKPPNPLLNGGDTMTVHTLTYSDEMDIVGFTFGVFTDSLAAGRCGSSETQCIDCWTEALRLPDNWQDDFNCWSKVYDAFAKTAFLITELRQLAITEHGVGKYSTRLPQVLMENEIHEAYWSTPPHLYRCDDCGQFLIPQGIKDKMQDELVAIKENQRAA
jgi:hypothetical protein